MATAPSRPESSRAAWFWNPLSPVHFDDRLDTWHAFSYADVSRVLGDRSVFSSGDGLTDYTRDMAHPALSGMWAADGARHGDPAGARLDGRDLPAGPAGAGGRPAAGTATLP